MLPIETFFRCSSEWHENKSAYAVLGKNDTAVHFFAASSVVPVDVSICSLVSGYNSDRKEGKVELRVAATCCKGSPVTVTEKELQLLRTRNAIKEWWGAPRCLNGYEDLPQEGVSETGEPSSVDVVSGWFLSEQVEALDILLSRAHLPCCPLRNPSLSGKLFFPGRSHSLFDSPIVRSYCAALSVIQPNLHDKNPALTVEGQPPRKKRWTLPRGWPAKSISETALRLQQSFFPLSFSSSEDESQGCTSSMRAPCRPWKVMKTTLNSRSVLVFSNPLIEIMNKENLHHSLHSCRRAKNAENEGSKRDSGMFIGPQMHLPEKEEEELRLTYLLAHLIALHGFEVVKNQSFLDDWILKDSQWFATHHFRCRYCGAHPKVNFVKKMRESSGNSEHSIPSSMDKLDLSSLRAPSAPSKELPEKVSALSCVESSSVRFSSLEEKKGSEENTLGLEDQSRGREEESTSSESSSSSALPSCLSSGEIRLPARSSTTLSHLALTFCWRKEYNSHCLCCPWNKLFLDKILGQAPSSSSSLPSSPGALKEVTFLWEKKMSSKPCVTEERCEEDGHCLIKTEDERTMEKWKDPLVRVEEAPALTFYFDSKELGYLLSALRFRQELLESAEKALVMPLELTHPLYSIMKDQIHLKDCIPMAVSNDLPLHSTECRKTTASASTDSSLSMSDGVDMASVLSRKEVEEFLSYLEQKDAKREENTKEVSVSTGGTYTITKKQNLDVLPDVKAACPASFSEALTIGSCQRVKSNVEVLTQLIWETLQPSMSHPAMMGAAKSKEALLCEAEKKILQLPYLCVNEDNTEMTSQNYPFVSNLSFDILEQFESQWNDLERLYLSNDEQKSSNKEENGGAKNTQRVRNAEDEKEMPQSAADTLLRHTYETILRLGPLFLSVDGGKESLQLDAGDGRREVEAPERVELTDEVTHTFSRALEIRFQEGGEGFPENKKEEERQNIDMPVKNRRKRLRSSESRKLFPASSSYLSHLDDIIKQYRMEMRNKLINFTCQQQEEERVKSQYALPSDVPKETERDHTSQTGVGFSTNTAPVQAPWHSFSSSNLLSSAGTAGDSGPLVSATSPFYAHGPPQPLPQSSHFSSSTEMHSFLSQNVHNTSAPPVKRVPARSQQSSSPYPPSFLFSSSLPTPVADVSYPSPSVLPVSSHTLACPPPSGLPASFGQGFSSPPAMGTGRSSGFSSSSSSGSSTRALGPVLSRHGPPSILGAGHSPAGSVGVGKNRGGSRGGGMRDLGRGSGAYQGEIPPLLQGGGKFKAISASTGPGGGHSGHKMAVRRGGAAGMGAVGSNGGPTIDPQYNTTNSGNTLGVRGGRGIGVGRGGRGAKGNRGGGNWKNRGD